MKLIQATLATAWLTASLALAVPSEINYQGVLTDSQGNLVNGNQTMSLKIYDSPTGGTLLYSEDLGTVPVNNGVYNFTFGANGISNALTTETIATTNGTASTFQKVLSASTVVAGSVTVTDGNYTWDQTNGSSNENDFGVSYNTGLRRVTVNYYNGAPVAGKTISASYRAPSVGISGAIDGSNQPWIETVINGTPQSPRQKVLTIPFALSATMAKNLEPKLYEVILPFSPVSYSTDSNGNNDVQTNSISIPLDIRTIENIEFKYNLKVTSFANGETSAGAKFNFLINSYNPVDNINESVYSYSDQIWYPSTGNFTKTPMTGKLSLFPENKIYTIILTFENKGSSNWSSNNSGSLYYIKVKYSK